jgi:hypothetical protein
MAKQEAADALSVTSAVVNGKIEMTESAFILNGIELETAQ